MSKMDKTALGIRTSKPSKPLTPSQMAWFAYELASMLKAGISPSEGLVMISNEDPYFAGIVQSITSEGNGKLHLYEALSQSGVFPRHFVTMVKLGETTGTLDRVMESLADYYEKQDYFSKEIESALTYPLVLILMVATVILIVSWKVLPIFEEILASLGVTMPAVARVLMIAGGFFGRNIIWFLLALAVIALFAWLYASTPGGKERTMRRKAESGRYGRLFQKIYTQRVATALAYALGSGLSMAGALAMAAETVGNDYVSERIEVCIIAVEQGEDLVEALTGSGVFPERFVNAVRIGLKTGDLPGMTMKVAELYEEDVNRTLQAMISAIEPTLVAVLSVLIGIVLVTVMLPLARIMASMG